MPRLAEKKTCRFLCVFVEGGEGIFTAKPVDFSAANDYDEGYGELFIPAHYEGKERTVFMDSDPYSNTAWNRRSAVAPACLLRA